MKVEMMNKKGRLSSRMIALAITVLLVSACAQNTMERADEAYKEFEQAIATGNPQECRREKEKCLAVIAEVVNEKKAEMRALQARVGADANRDIARDSPMIKALKDLEAELSDLSIKENKVKSVVCEK